MGQSLETLYSEAPGKIASELALHFEAARNWSSAAKYRQLAAANKGQRFAYREAAADLEHALKLLGKLPPGESETGEIEVMQKLGAIYFALEDFPTSISMLETVAMRATMSHDNVIEISTLIPMGIVLGRMSASQSAKVGKRLLELCDQQEDPVLRARARMGGLMLRLTNGGAKEQDAQEFRAELGAVRNRLDERALAGHATEYAAFQLFWSQYQESIRNIEESLPVLVEMGDIRHRAALLLLLINLIFSGGWGEALRVVRNAIATEQKNGNHSREYVLGLYQAWVHLMAHDWNGTLQLCEAALPLLQDPFHVGFLRQGLILAGRALVGLGRYEAALKYLAQAREQMDAEPVALDWYWRLPLQAALTELSLQCGDLEQARLEAQRFIEISLATWERTWQALAWEAAARVALAGSDLEESRNCIRKAIAAMAGVDVPLAFWRVHATAMQLFREAAEEHYPPAAAGISRLAASLKEFPKLKEIFLSSELVRGITPSKVMQTYS